MQSRYFEPSLFDLCSPPFTLSSGPLITSSRVTAVVGSFFVVVELPILRDLSNHSRSGAIALVEQKANRDLCFAYVTFACTGGTKPSQSKHRESGQFDRVRAGLFVERSCWGRGLLPESNGRACCFDHDLRLGEL